MNKTKVIFKKELKKVFTDKRMLCALFLPGILIFLIYSLMGNFLHNSVLVDDKITNTTYYIAYTDNCGAEEPKLLSYLDVYIKLEESNETTNKIEKIKIKKTSSGEISDEDIEKLNKKEYSLILSFSDNFETNIYDLSKIETTKLEYFYKGEDKVSSHIYSLTNSIFVASYSKAYYTIGNKNISESNYTMNKIISFIVPMLTVSLLYSTVISICPETFAGEKERGTLANLLLTPMKRSELVTGKIFALICIAILSGSVSFVGMILSLPKMMQGSTLTIGGGQIAILFLLIISILLLFVTFGTLVSSFTKTTKEANSYLGPLAVVFMLLSILPSVSSMNSLGYAFIPIINISSCMSSIISLGVSGFNLSFFLITIVTNIVLSVLMIFLTTKLFKKEKYLL